jgi:hypothetical protein
MTHLFLSRLVLALCACLLLAACGGSPTAPPPPPPPPPPPANSLPSIDGIAVQGRRAGQPARFADVRETVDVVATVRDAETPVDELTYQWTATTGTFTGAGRAVTWTAPESASTPAMVTITLKVIENYGHPGQPRNYSQEVSGTQTLALHDSGREVGEMAVRFLTEFSKPQTNQDWQDVMRDFKAAACARPGEVDAERLDVVNHYENFVMHAYTIGQPTVNVAFGGSCAFRPANLVGDACAITTVDWDSTDLRNGSRARTQGRSHISASYSTADTRWWLCGSHFEPTTSLLHPFYAR